MKYLLQKLSDVIAQFHGPNVVIGGKWALKLHGIKMSTEPEDIDFVIYEPTQDQIKFLNTIRPFDLAKTLPYDRQHYKTEDLKVMKFKKNDIAFDIIQEKNPCPDNLLTLRFENHLLHDGCLATISASSSVIISPSSIEGLNFKIQSVENVIAAKVSYSLELKKEDGLHTYQRSKDLFDLLDLKNQNFNL